MVEAEEGSVSEWVAVVAIGSILINLGLLGLSLKLYTEYFKDRSIARRTWRKDSAA